MGFWRKFVDRGLGNSEDLREEVGEVGGKQSFSGKKSTKEESKVTIPVVSHLSEVQPYDIMYDKKPALGSVVYCQLDDKDHSGIYVGDDMIIQLNAEGKIEKVSLADFTSKITTGSTDIWFPCNNENGQALGLCTVVYIALEIIDNSENYNLALDNSHQFISGCITNTFENADKFLWMLKHTFEEKFDCNVIWKRWEW